MPDEDSDLGPRIALQAARNLRRGPAARKSPRSLAWLLGAAWVLIAVMILSALVDIGLDAWRTAHPPEPRPLFVCLELRSSDGVTSRTGDDPCWAGIPGA